jgi:hypothetical protein
VRAIRFHRDALTELREQAIYYERQSKGLGMRFVNQIEHATRLAATLPAAGSPYKYGTRRVFPKDFPFSVVYREFDDGIVIIAVAAFRRRPGYWSHRKNDDASLAR